MADPARSADIAKTIGLGTTRTNDLLREMVHAGDIVACGKTRAREYRLAENKAKNKLMGQRNGPLYRHSD